MQKVKYKLIKKYPNSPELDTVVQLDPTTKCFVVIKSRTTNVGLHIPQCQITCFPEFWTKIYEVEDGEVTENDDVWIIDKNTNLNIYRLSYRGAAIDGTYPADRIFVNKENAEAKLKEVKGLEYYKDKVRKRISDDGIFGSDIRFIFNYLEKFQPKYFYLMVLEEIANDLNGDWKPDWSKLVNNTVYVIVIHEKKYTFAYTYCANGVVYFKSSDNVIKAIEIMGDNLKYIFN